MVICRAMVVMSARISMMRLRGEVNPDDNREINPEPNIIMKDA